VKWVGTGEKVAKGEGLGVLLELGTGAGDGSADSEKLARPQLLPSTLLQSGVKHSWASWYNPNPARVANCCALVALKPMYIRQMTVGSEALGCCTEKAAHAWKLLESESDVWVVSGAVPNCALEPT
jgi:hypothetical protein